ncbi:caspase family protein [Agromyces sp. SYSU K20354]|uniref:VMAP-C domain-containing protein n=1 Tax=Agromyces cavernae TaxID=2898659 RepID=UPI001E5649AF|nr:caspase family protein [Agromyces cavernae]MCD2441865.1 caspase family protein [Agromyces cavernae]
MATISTDKVLVLAIGLEDYAYGETFSLPGVASDAVRFAQWAVNCSVPPKQVWLARSWSGAETPAPDGVLTFAGTQHDLEDLFIKASRERGDLLVVYWSGHGVLNRDGQRVLYAADAYADAPRVFVVDQVLRYLTSDAFPGFDNQVVFIDACANFAAEMKIPDDLASGPLNPNGRTFRGLSQSTLFAASQGEYATHDRLKREAAFSDSLFRWLEQNVSLPIDFPKVVQHIDDSFEELNAKGVTRQHPVTRIFETGGGGRNVHEFGGGIPVSGRTQEVLSSTGMSPRQLNRVERELRSGAALTEAELRQELLTALDGQVDGSGQETVDLVALVVTNFDNRRRLIEALQARAATPAERSFDLETFLDRQRAVSSFVEAFGTINRQQMNEAFRIVVPERTGSMPADLEQALEFAAAYSGPPAYESLTKFAVSLECLTGNQLPDELFDPYISRPNLNLLRAGAAAPAEGIARLVIEIPCVEGPEARFSWPAEVVAHVKDPRNGWQPKSVVSCQRTPDGFREAAIPLIIQMASDYPSFSVGFLLPRAAFVALPERWPFAASPLEASRPLGQAWPTALHVAERRAYEPVFRQWKNAVERIAESLQFNSPTLEWISGTSSVTAIQDSVAGSKAHLQGFDFAIGTVPDDLRRDPLIASIVGGAPYVFWATDPPSDWIKAKQMLEQFVSDGDFTTIPERLLALRRGDSEGLASTLRLVWDDPDSLPPRRSELPAMA